MPIDFIVWQDIQRVSHLKGVGYFLRFEFGD